MFDLFVPIVPIRNIVMTSMLVYFFVDRNIDVFTNIV